MLGNGSPRASNVFLEFLELLQEHQNTLFFPQSDWMSDVGIVCGKIILLFFCNGAFKVIALSG